MSIRFDRWAAVVFLLLGTGFVVESRNISQTAFGSSVGPDMFPFGLGVLLILFSLRLFYETFKSPEYKRSTVANSDASADGTAENEAATAAEAAKPNYKRFWLIFGAAVLYAFFLEEIGYVIGTFLFLVFAFQVLERGRWWRTIIIAAAFSLTIYIVFVKILYGTLPGFPSWLPIPL